MIREYGRHGWVALPACQVPPRRVTSWQDTTLTDAARFGMPESAAGWLYGTATKPACHARPLPSSPLVSWPKHQRVPSRFSAHVKLLPAATCTQSVSVPTWYGLSS